LNYYQAQELLTAVKYGQPATLRDINLALYLTGDYCGPLCEDGLELSFDRPCSPQSEGVGERRDWFVGRTWQGSSQENQGAERC